MRIVRPDGKQAVAPSDLDRVQAQRLRRAVRRKHRRRGQSGHPGSATPVVTAEPVQAVQDNDEPSVAAMVAQALQRQTRATSTALSFAAALGETLRRADEND